MGQRFGFICLLSRRSQVRILLGTPYIIKTNTYGILLLSIIYLPASADGPKIFCGYFRRFLTFSCAKTIHSPACSVLIAYVLAAALGSIGRFVVLRRMCAVSLANRLQGLPVYEHIFLHLTNKISILHSQNARTHVDNS